MTVASRIVLFAAGIVSTACLRAQNSSPIPTLASVVSGWKMQDAAKVIGTPAEIAGAAFRPDGWYTATVPGTVLTTLVDHHVYPEPTYGENNRPEIIPESLARSSFWYRTVVAIPKAYAGKHIWLDFEGINYSSEVWVQGSKVGTTRGAFRRGIFDISPFVKPGATAVIAVLVSPQPHPGDPQEQTIRAGAGLNGGITALDGPTFLSTIGWDWIPGIRDRDTGIWREVHLLATGPVLLKDPYVTTDLKVPGYATAGVTVKTVLENISDQPQKGVLKGSIGQIAFEQAVELAPHSSRAIAFSPETTPQLLLQHPKLWWPNGYGEQALYRMHLSFEMNKSVSSEHDLSFGVRKIEYAAKASDSLAFVVNGVPIFIRGGNWGMDEAMKRIPFERMEAQIRMHQLAHLNLIRNWVGQSTSEQFYELCDKYGLLIWDEFFQPNPSDGPNPTDIETYLANVHDKIVRYRNHPSIALWCARNEGYPPKELDEQLRAMLAELDPLRRYQANSADGGGVRSAGPYHWRAPREYYRIAETLKTETGSMSIPTIESIQGMMPQKDWETITDDWAEHDFAQGAAGGDVYREIIATRYGKLRNLADFTRKSQLANYEAYRAMYEGRNAELFHFTTGVITWMSHPAQPSFAWQIYHYDLEPNASFFGVMHASEMLHVQFNEVSGKIQVVNNHAKPVHAARAVAKIFNLDGTLSTEQSFPVEAEGSSVASVGQLRTRDPLTDPHFLQLQLIDADGKLVSQNFYWKNQPEDADTFAKLEKMPGVTLDAQATRTDSKGVSTIQVTLRNNTSHIALMSHLQLHQQDGSRVLPAYYSDNYVSLIGGETRVISIECETRQFGGGPATVLVDGFNIAVTPSTGDGVAVAMNQNAQVDHWPETGIPVQTQNLR